VYLEINLQTRELIPASCEYSRWSTSDSSDDFMAFRGKDVGFKLTQGTDDSVIKINSNELSISRGFSGEDPIYYSTIDDFLIISDRISKVNDRVKSPLSVYACYEYIYFEYPGKPRTLFSEIKEVLNGQTLSFSLSLFNELQISVSDRFSIQKNEVKSSDEQTVTKQLREHIVHAHASRVGSANGVLLSGGIDSQVMSITLMRDLGLTNTFGATFSVAGAPQNESGDAKKVATQLGMNWISAEVDPNKEFDWNSLIRNNNPYLGSISIGRLLDDLKIQDGTNTVLFAGQDTRLHTPALGSKDQLLWNTVLRRDAFLKFTAFGANFLRSTITKKRKLSFIDRALDLFSHSTTFSEFLTNRYFHARRFEFNADNSIFRSIFSAIATDLSGLSSANKRNAYNRVVEVNWRRQYLFDIGYMVESCEKGSLRCAMPFYDHELSKFSSGLSFDLATKMSKGRSGHSSSFTKVNKYVLRKAYERELDADLIFREKAVCATNYLFFNGVLKELLEKFCQDLDRVHSREGVALQLPQIQEICRQKKNRWQQNDNWICNVVFNALVVWSLMEFQGFDGMRGFD
jgi:asparagine synthase (glutamine-hydrolysing)